MMAVSAGADHIAELLPPTLQIASNNAPNLCVVSGPEPDVEAFRESLEAAKIGCRHLHTSHAFHSAMMDPMIEPLREAIAKIKLRAPLKAVCLDSFGTSYHRRGDNRSMLIGPIIRGQRCSFPRRSRYLKEQGYDLFLECGPRSTLCSLARKQFTPDHPCMAIPSLADTAENDTEWVSFAICPGRTLAERRVDRLGCFLCA